MKRFLLFILTMTAFTMCLLFPTTAYATETLSVSGDWSVEYEIDDSAVTASGGNAIVSLFVTNTSSTTSIYYASIDLGAGRDSHFYQIDPLIDLNPGLSQTLRYTVPISASDVGVSMNMWAAMSQGSQSDTDGIGVIQVVIGEGPRYEASFEFNLSATEVDAGETVTATTTTINNGNRDSLIKVYNISGGIIGEYVLSPGAGIHFEESIAVSATRDFQYKVEVYNAAGSELKGEVAASTQRVTVRQPPTAAPTSTPTATPSQSPTGTPTATPTNTPVVSPSLTPNPTVTGTGITATPIEEDDILANTNDTKTNKKNIGLLVVIFILVILIISVVAILLIIIFRGKKADAVENSNE